MTRRPSPLLGCNTGVVHGGHQYHVQTEDSGVGHPHVITHLFADGGRIVATRKTSYAEHVDTPAYPEVVRQLIRTQHEAMIAALHAGDYDALLPPPLPGAAQVVALPRPAASTPPPRPAPVVPSPASAPPREPAAMPTRTRPRAHHPSLRGAVASDSLDEIIVADLLADEDD